MSSTTSAYYEGQYDGFYTSHAGLTSGVSIYPQPAPDTDSEPFTGVTRGYTGGATFQHNGTTNAYAISVGTGSFGSTTISNTQSTSAGTFTDTEVSTSTGTPSTLTLANYYDSLSTGAEFTTEVCSTRTITTSSTDQASTEKYQATFTYTAKRYNYDTESVIKSTYTIPNVIGNTFIITETQGVYYTKTTFQYDTDSVIVYTVPKGFGAVPSIYPASAVLQGTIAQSVFGGPRDATIYDSVTTSQATSYETKTKTLTSASMSSFTYETNSQTSTHTAGSVSKTYTNSYTEPKTYVISADTNEYTSETTGSTVATITGIPETNYGTTAITISEAKGTTVKRRYGTSFSALTSNTSNSMVGVFSYTGAAGVCKVVRPGLKVTVITPNLPDGFIGFGFSTNAQSLAAYKTISVGTSGSSFSNIETSGITSDLIIKKIGSYGGKLIVTGKCGLPANNSSRSLSWYTEPTTPDFGTASTLEGTHASTYTETYTNANSTLTSTLTSTAGMSFLFSCVSSITDKEDFVSYSHLESTTVFSTFGVSTSVQKAYFQTYLASIGHHDALTRDRTLVFMPGDYTFHKTINGAPSEVVTHISDLWVTSIMPDNENWLIEKQDVYQCYTVNAPNQGVVQHPRFYSGWNYNWPPEYIYLTP